MRNQRSLRALRDISLIQLIAVEHVVHDAVAVGIREEFLAVAHQAARRDFKFQVRHARVARTHVDHLGLSAAELLHHRAHIGIRHLDHQKLDRLIQLAVDLLVNHMRARYLELIVLAAHLLDEDRQVQLAAAGDFKGIGGIGFLHAHGHVRLDLLEQAVAQVAACHILALAARKGAVVDHEQHGDGRLVNLDEGQRLNTVRCAGRLADVQIRKAGHRHQIAQRGRLDLHTAQSLKLVKLADLHVAGGTVAAAEHHGLSVAHRTALHAANTDAAHIIVMVNVGKQNLRRAVPVALGSGNLAQDHLKQRLHIRAGDIRIRAGVAVAAGRIHHGEFQLIIVHAKFNKQVEHLVDHLERARAGAIHLVDHNDRLLAKAERLFQHKARLGHAALKGIHQQQHAVHHHQDALHLAAEIGVAGRIHNVDLHAVVADGGVFGKDGNAALTLQIVGVHNALGHRLVAAENAALAQKLVDQRGFAVVDVRDDGNISDIRSHIHTCVTSSLRQFRGPAVAAPAPFRSLFRPQKGDCTI